MPTDYREKELGVMVVRVSGFLGMVGEGPGAVLIGEKSAGTDRIPSPAQDRSMAGVIRTAGVI